MAGVGKFLPAVLWCVCVLARLRSLAMLLQHLPVAILVRPHALDFALPYQHSEQPSYCSPRFANAFGNLLFGHIGVSRDYVEDVFYRLIVASLGVYRLIYRLIIACLSVCRLVYRLIAASLGVYRLIYRLAYRLIAAYLSICKLVTYGISVNFERKSNGNTEEKIQEVKSLMSITLCYSGYAIVCLFHQVEADEKPRQLLVYGFRDATEDYSFRFTPLTASADTGSSGQECLG